MKKSIMKVVALLGVFLGLFGSSFGVVDAQENIQVALVFAGNLGDKSFNDSAKLGADQAIEDFGVEVKMIEGVTPEEWEANLLAVADQGYDIVIAASSNFEEYMKAIAPMYPDVKFAIIDTTVEEPNVQSISFAQNEGSFLAGAAAALWTQETDLEGVNEDAVIGWVGGMEIPVLQDFFVGYKEGAEFVNPEVTVLQAYAQSWTDPLKGKELTLAQYEQGADIVMNVASGTGPGVLEAAAEAGKYAIGVDLNQDHEQPGHIVTSMVKRIDTAVYSIIESVINDSFEGGTTQRLDLSTDGVSLTDFSVMKEALGEQFPEHIIEELENIREQIESGEVVVGNAPGFGEE